MRRLSRRDFLRLTAGAAVGIELNRLLAEPAAAASAPLATPSAGASGWPLAAVSQGTSSDAGEAILKVALDAVGGLGRFVKAGQVVTIKPNATWAYPPKTASSTDPDLLRALIMMVHEAGAKQIYVVDRLTIFDKQSSLQISGIGKALEGLPIETVFYDGYTAPDDACTTIDLARAQTPDFQKLNFLKAAVESDVRINLALAKSHLVVPATLCMKHMMGFMQTPNQLHSQLYQGIVDINTVSAIQATLHILEAIQVRLPFGAARQAGGDETEITNPHIVKRINQMVVGTDPVLIDSYAFVTYFGMEPKQLEYLQLAGEQGLGETDVKQALADGRLRTLSTTLALATAVPSPTATRAPTATPVRSAAAARAAALTPAPTSTPLPTPTYDPGLAQPAAQEAAGASQVPDVLDPDRFLSGALLPAAAVVGGAGAVAGRRLRRKEKRLGNSTNDPQPLEEQAVGRELGPSSALAEAAAHEDAGAGEEPAALG
jgi:uncharacterized protein (DUF362 family)